MQIRFGNTFQTFGNQAKTIASKKEAPKAENNELKTNPDDEKPDFQKVWESTEFHLSNGY